MQSDSQISVCLLRARRLELIPILRGPPRRYGLCIYGPEYEKRQLPISTQATVHDLMARKNPNLRQQNIKRHNPKMWKKEMDFSLELP